MVASVDLGISVGATVGRGGAVGTSGVAVVASWPGRPSLGRLALPSHSCASVAGGALYRVVAAVGVVAGTPSVVGVPVVAVVVVGAPKFASVWVVVAAVLTPPSVLKTMPLTPNGAPKIALPMSSTSVVGSPSAHGSSKACRACAPQKNRGPYPPGPLSLQRLSC
jgi:hypothetical protein